MGMAVRGILELGVAQGDPDGNEPGEVIAPDSRQMLYVRLGYLSIHAIAAN